MRRIVRLVFRSWVRLPEVMGGFIKSVLRLLRYSYDENLLSYAAAADAAADSQPLWLTVFLIQNLNGS